MDVSTEGFPSPPSPMVDEASSGCESEKSGKDRLIELLDQVEMHVERLRKEALKIEEERDTLFTTLDTVRNSDVLSTLVESKFVECKSLYYFVSVGRLLKYNQIRVFKV